MFLHHVVAHVGGDNATGTAQIPSEHRAMAAVEATEDYRGLGRSNGNGASRTVVEEVEMKDRSVRWRLAR